MMNKVKNKIYFIEDIKMVKNYRFDGPFWAWKILNEIEKEYNLKLGKMEWRYINLPGYDFFQRFQKASLTSLGVFYPTKNGLIYINLFPEKDEETLFVLLHEISHFIHEKTKLYTYDNIINLVDTIRNKRKFKNILDRNKRNNHNKDFFKIAYKLYKKYNILNYALENDFPIKGRKFMEKFVKLE